MIGSMNEHTYYLVTYRNPEKVKELETISIKVKEIKDSTLGLGFISLSGFIFDSQSLIVSPIEDKLKAKFENTKSLHLSIHHIISIEEVGTQNKGLKFRSDKSNLYILSQDPLN